MKKIAIIAAAALTSCQPEPSVDNAAQPSTDAATPAAPAAAAAKKVEEKSDILEFSYSWPAEAAAIPGLNKQLEEELGRDRVEAQATARQSKAEQGEGGTDFFSHSFSKEWQLAGNTPRLLSMVGEAGSFTGGAHPNSDYDGIIWDRQASRPIGLTDLFSNGGEAMAALSRRYCHGLDAARVEKRGEVIPASPDDFMSACPTLSDQTVVLADTNGNGRFDTLQVWLPPSVAGPYAEGGYQVDLKVEAATLAALKPDYRASFES